MAAPTLVDPKAHIGTTAATMNTDPVVGITLPVPVGSSPGDHVVATNTTSAESFAFRLIPEDPDRVPLGTLRRGRYLVRV